MPYTTATAVDRPRLADELTSRLDALAAAHQVPGAQLAVDTGSQVITWHTGLADAATATPFTADTAVPLGSLTKPYTAAAVLLLAEDGDLDLDDPVAEHLPELRALPAVTVRQLLSHTAGLPSGPDSDTAAGTTRAHYLARACAPDELLFDPGTDFSYSNAGYVAAGHLVAAVTGMEWAEALRVLLLDPLGTVPAVLGGPVRRALAGGHAVNTASGELRPARQNLAPAEAPAGALLASAVDLMVFGRALAGRSEVLPPAVADLLRTVEPAAGPSALADGWGPGLAAYRTAGPTWYGHDGNAQGTSCHLRIEPVSGLVVAFTGNAGAATALWRDVAAELARFTGRPVPATVPAARRGPGVPLPESAGRYRNGGTEYLVATGPDGSPTLSVDGDLPLPLRCYPDLSCDLVDPDSGLLQAGGGFRRDPAGGAIDRLQISGRTARRVS
ncbi:serine hydrolase domain-containing protein [Kitasatospora viridis]|uniref:CubicO group peptidase (Beta-lactamase class C family) n=1 Tax=Kitasatospora viridis TaxID=281105 RepID=A0A561S9H0_9ACTN|nr:serine hydrolase domain-containing protein [Kitasatospora viridis]TWF71518.1 CubicO group peptidase (beta-lactamase class C family) [Kitasatospora viridis]